MFWYIYYLKYTSQICLNKNFEKFENMLKVQRYISTIGIGIQFLYDGK